MRTMLTTILIIVICITGVSVINACSSSELSGPPTIKLGRHECKECGMLVNEDRCSSALLVDDRGRRDYWHFDDIGCMLDAERKHKDDVRVLERFVRDHASREWITVEQATFVMAHPKKLHTPMGTGIVAFSTRSDAEATQREHAGEVHDFAALTRARIAWLEKQFGSLEDK